MDKIPATVEDWIATLFPGLVLLLGLAWVYPIPSLQNYEGSKILLLILAGYVVGHLLRGVVSIAVTSWCEKLAVESAWERFEAKDAVENTLKENLGVSGKTPTGTEGMCLGFLPQTLPRRDGFQVAASFNSSMVITASSLLVTELVRHGLSRIGCLGLVLTLLFVILFLRRYYTLRRYSALEAFNRLIPVVSSLAAQNDKPA